MREDWRSVGEGIWRRQGTGPHIAVVGSLHGDEPAGAAVVEELLRDHGLDWEAAGDPTVTLAVGNPQALALGERGTTPEADLNRLFGDGDRPAAVESERVEALKEALRGVDRLLDIHQTSCETPPLAVGPDTGAHRLAARALGLEVLVTAAGALYGGGMLAEWVDREGGLGLTVETGRKGTTFALAMARDLALRFLFPDDTRPGSPTVRVYRLELAVPAPRAPLSFRRELGNTTPVSEGEIIGASPDGPLVIPWTGAVFLPREEAAPGEPCLLLARDLGEVP